MMISNLHYTTWLCKKNNKTGTIFFNTLTHDLTSLVPVILMISKTVTYRDGILSPSVLGNNFCTFALRSCCLETSRPPVCFSAEVQRPGSL